MRFTFTLPIIGITLIVAFPFKFFGVSKVLNNNNFFKSGSARVLQCLGYPLLYCAYVLCTLIVLTVFSAR